MSSFKLQQDGFTSYTCVANCFIERYMPKAAGEFVKIYIYLLKCVEENKSELSISRIADAFENTQKDVIRALKYWEKKGLLKLSFDGDILSSIKIVSLSDMSSDDESAVKIPEKVVVNVTPATVTKKQYTKEETSLLMENEDIPQIIYVVQKYMGKTLTSAEVNSILFFYDGLKLPTDVIEYLFEYCISKEKKNMRYIEKTAIAWAEKGISNANAAKALNALYDENMYPVLRAFGLSGRAASAKETEYVSKWTLSYGFSPDIIVEACTRTMNTIHQPSFEYTDSILEKWKNQNVTGMEDIKELDKKHAALQAAHTAKASKSTNKFNNFEQRSDDVYARLEEVIYNR